MPADNLMCGRAKSKRGSRFAQRIVPTGSASPR
jgi:hypothetical protein